AGARWAGRDLQRDQPTGDLPQRCRSRSDAGVLLRTGELAYRPAGAAQLSRVLVRPLLAILGSRVLGPAQAGPFFWEQEQGRNFTYFRSDKNPFLFTRRHRTSSQPS